MSSLPRIPKAIPPKLLLADADEFRQGLLVGYHAAVEQLLILYQNNPESQNKLRDLEQQRWSLVELTQDPSVSYLFRLSDKADFTPALLSEPLSTIELLIKHSGPDVLNQTRVEVKKMLNESPEARNYLLYHPQHLSALGVPVKG